MNDLPKSLIETIAEKLVAQLREGTAPWQKPWQPGEPGAFLPFNPTTGNRYKGINALHLMSEGHADQRWMTYKQAASAGAQVRQGEKGTPIQYWKFSEEQGQTDADGKPMLASDGRQARQSVRLERPQMFFSTVFNASQIDGLAPLAPGQLLPGRRPSGRSGYCRHRVPESSMAVARAATAPSTGRRAIPSTCRARSSSPRRTITMRRRCMNSGTGRGTPAGWAATLAIPSAARNMRGKSCARKSPACCWATSWA